MEMNSLLAVSSHYSIRKLLFIVVFNNAFNA